MGAGHKEKPRLLVESESISDLKIGFYYLLNELDRKMMNSDLLDLDLERLRRLRFIDKNFIYTIFRQDVSKQTVDEVYSNLYNDYYDRLFMLSPPVPALEPLLSVCNAKSGKNAAMHDICHILYSNDVERLILQSKYPELTKIHSPRTEVFKTDSYARIIIPDPKHIYKYNTSFTLFAVIAFPENIEYTESGYKAIVDPDALLALGATNHFELIDPYPNN